MPQRSLARDREELGAFLRERREAISPLDVGLSASARRRTPGLRREEVAALAGVGLTWYTWFEQGRAVNVSAAFLGNIARALRLNAAEHAHLFLLAGHGQPAPESGAPIVPDAIEALIAELVDRPAFIKDARWDIVAWNAACAHVFGDFAEVPPEHRNSLWLTFADTRYRRSIVDWEGDARRMVGRFRADYSRSSKDPRLAELVADLERQSAEFRRLWRDHEVLGRDSGIRTIRVPRIGATRFHYTVLAVEGAHGLKLVLYSPMVSEPNGARFAGQRAASVPA